MRQAGCTIMPQAGVSFWQLSALTGVCCMCVCLRARPMVPVCVCVRAKVCVCYVSEMYRMEASCVSYA
jgi:hypothetical protein